MRKNISVNNRCKVYDYGDYIKKIYVDSDSFEREKRVYIRLNDKNYIPKLIDIDEKNEEIIIEKILFKDLSYYINIKKELPNNLLKELRKIRLDFLEYGFYEYGDFYNANHIFIEELDSNKINRIVVIDFDKISDLANNEIEDRKKYIIATFDELNTNMEVFKRTF